MIVSKAAYTTRQRTALWLWFAVFSVGSFIQPVAVLTAEAKIDRDVTPAMLRQEMRRTYSAVEGELSCAERTGGESSAPCVLQLRDQATGRVYSLQGMNSSELTQEFLAGQRKTASIEGEMRAEGSSILVRVSQ